MGGEFEAYVEDLAARGEEIARERVLYWADEDGRPSGMGFSVAEMGLLTDKKDAIAQAVKVMRRAKVPP